jgi:hypothetical protein
MERTSGTPESCGRADRPASGFEEWAVGDPAGCGFERSDEGKRAATETGGGTLKTGPGPGNRRWWVRDGIGTAGRRAAAGNFVS